jgi:hypothetical protein
MYPFFYHQKSHFTKTDHSRLSKRIGLFIKNLQKKLKTTYSYSARRALTNRVRKNESKFCSNFAFFAPYLLTLVTSSDSELKSNGEQFLFKISLSKIMIGNIYKQHALHSVFLFIFSSQKSD